MFDSPHPHDGSAQRCISCFTTLNLKHYIIALVLCTIWSWLSLTGKVGGLRPERIWPWAGIQSAFNRKRTPDANELRGSIPIRFSLCPTQSPLDNLVWKSRSRCLLQRIVVLWIWKRQSWQRSTDEWAWFAAPEDAVNCVELQVRLSCAHIDLQLMWKRSLLNVWKLRELSESELSFQQWERRLMLKSNVVKVIYLIDISDKREIIINKKDWCQKATR